MQTKLFLVGLLLVSAALVAAVDEKNVTARPHKIRRGDNLVPRIISTLTLRLKDQLQLMNPKVNAIFSPVSITSVLGMTMLGARGRTYKEIANLLLGSVPGNMEKKSMTMHRKLKFLLERLAHHPQSKPGAHVALANAMFVQKGISVLEEFSKSIENIYRSDVKQLDFVAEPEAAKTAINKWVEDSTNGSIKELISEPLDGSTQLVLANAINFVGEWEYPFDPKETKMQPFHGTKGDVEVPMMQGSGGFSYYHEAMDLNCSVLGLPYKGKHVTMYFIQPTNNLTDFLAAVSPEELLSLKDKAILNEEQVILSIPKMKLDSTIKLEEPLQRMGLKTLFGTGANLRGISEGVFVNDAVHKVHIEVSETGTIAAAVTAFSMTRMSHPFFILNKPFLFLIYHEKAKVPLFWGTVWDLNA